MEKLIDQLIEANDYSELKSIVQQLRFYGEPAIDKLLELRSGKLTVNDSINLRDAYERLTEAAIEISKDNIDYFLLLFDKELDNANSSKIRSMTYIIRHLKSLKSLPLIEKGLNHKDSEVRKQCLLALYKLDSPRKTDLYLKAIRDQSENVQLVGIKGLRQFGDKRGLNELDKFVSSENVLLRVEALRAIYHINLRGT